METVQDCENKLPPSLKSRLCEIRRYEIIEGPEMDKHIHCVMRALDFVYEDGRGDYHKLYDPLNIIELDKRHDVNLEKCIGECVQVPTSERAHVFYKCLLKSTTGRTFKKVFDLMELKKAGKVPQHQRYTAEFVQIMKDYDKALNC
uniref:D7r4 protein n=1 Tax=Anopheles gambiae TaxID=7165 RepID=UPI0001753DA6|nr:Chain A, D7r4 protein [Anopheles gambiae]2QEB_A Chain A, D7R4 Protein [Anopheles gambiae]2QEB_B Chain B, D7R4 Protein [Anopheles gambiae]2QEH_A Chain A, D7R4 Protein [Anopheles gambiae]2QEO_A Chain A, D7R4 Protein [Anopheles gambiae]2QEO_B Chain B, D7R4 Protein [Anopheles gambiae]2QEV_A Chain A, D7R4 Protein [Anopheles gambiae]